MCFQFLDAVFNLPTECKSGYSWMMFLFMYHVSEGNYCKRHLMLDHGICHSTLRFSHTFKFQCSIRKKARFSNCHWKPDSNPVEWNGEQMVSLLFFFLFFLLNMLMPGNLRGKTDKCLVAMCPICFCKLVSWLLFAIRRECRELFSCVYGKSFSDDRRWFYCEQKAAIRMWTYILTLSGYELAFNWRYLPLEDAVWSQNWHFCLHPQATVKLASRCWTTRGNG